ncbi:MAG TPA: phage holin family protein [Kofleriaceae bacterium]|nr:phage holin family protein [Kofleriaceae bacterium]
MNDPSETPMDGESSKELVREFMNEGKHLVHEQVRLMRMEVQTLVREGRERMQHDMSLAKTELKEEGAKLTRAGGAVGLGGILAHAAMYFVLFAAVFALDLVLPLWAATLIVAAVVGVVAAFLISGGINRIKRVRFVPRRTVQHLQEDRQWMNEKTHALKSAIRATA